MTYTIRRYKPTDRKQVIELRKNIPIISYSNSYPKIFDWKFKYALKKKEIPFWIIEENKKVVAMMPCIPLQMKFGNKTKETIWAVDVGKHKNWKDKKLGILKLYKLFRDSGALSISKGITDISYDLEMKMKWKNMNTPHYFKIKPLRTKNFFKHFIKNNPLSIILSILAYIPLQIYLLLTKPKKTINIEETTTITEEYENFWKKINKQYQVIVPRTKEYLTWKFDEHPLFNYKKFVAKKNDQMIGYLICRTENNHYLYPGIKFGFISDFLIDNNEKQVMKSLLAQAEEHFKQEKVEVIATASSWKQHNHLLSKYGYIRRPGWIRSTYYMNDETITNDFSQGTNIFLTLSDGDGDMQ